MSSDRIGDVFPADDPEARFIVAMSMARNDVKLAVQRAAQANADDAPEFGYFVRLSYGHLAEGSKRYSAGASTALKCGASSRGCPKTPRASGRKPKRA